MNHHLWFILHWVKYNYFGRLSPKRKEEREGGKGRKGRREEGTKEGKKGREGVREREKKRKKEAFRGQEQN